MKVLIVDQFSGVTPYYLQQNPTPFDDLCEELLEHEKKSPNRWNPTRVEEVDGNTFVPPRCTSVFAATDEGLAYLFKWNWDTSG